VVDDLTQGRTGFARCDRAALAARVRAESGRRFDPAVVDAWFTTGQPG